MKHSATQPIGIFDSGIGGLTVAHAIVKQLPNENIIYFGDTAHLPYGDKSAESIQGYSIKIANLLLQKRCKLILIACNTATATAYQFVKKELDGKADVLNVIDPTVDFIGTRYAHKKIGLIATRQTVNSNVYARKIESLDQGIQLSSLATNLLAAAIEEFGNSRAIDGLLEEYLSHSSLQNLDALLLACTHYPIIKNKIAAYFKHKVAIIDSSDIVADYVKDYLTKNNLLNSSTGSKKQFYVSDYTDSFAAGTKIFFDETISLEHYPLWM